MSFDRKKEAAIKMKRYKELTKNLEEMQRFLQKTLLNDSGNKDELENRQIIKRIDDIRKTRTTLLQEIMDIYKKELKMAKSNKKTINISNRLTNILKKELSNTDKQIDMLKSNKNNKNRLAKLGTWEYKRYESHLNIMKNILMFIVLLIMLLYIKNINIIKTYSYVTGPFISIVIFIVSIYFIYNIINLVYWNALRDNIDWDIIDNGGVGGLSHISNDDGGNNIGLMDLFKNAYCDAPDIKAPRAKVNINTESFVNDNEHKHNYYFI